MVDVSIDMTSTRSNPLDSAKANASEMASIELATVERERERETVHAAYVSSTARGTRDAE